MDGGHDLERCAEVTEGVLKKVFMQLYEARVFLEGIVLKPNMVVRPRIAASARPEPGPPEVRVFLATRGDNAYPFGSPTHKQHAFHCVTGRRDHRYHAELGHPPSSLTRGNAGDFQPRGKYTPETEPSG
jgi:Fructose-bisphosphate aldolase class-I